MQLATALIISGISLLFPLVMYILNHIAKRRNRIVVTEISIIDEELHLKVNKNHSTYDEDIIILEKEHVQNFFNKFMLGFNTMIILGIIGLIYYIWITRNNEMAGNLFTFYSFLTESCITNVRMYQGKELIKYLMLYLPLWYGYYEICRRRYFIIPVLFGFKCGININNYFFGTIDRKLI